MPVEAGDLAWETTTTYGEALGQIEEGLFAEFWYLPRDVHDGILEETRAWVERQPDGRATVETMHPFLKVEAFRKQPGERVPPPGS